MLLIDQMLEKHVQEAQERGDFDGLPGAGQPLELADDSDVPAELRAGYRLLKNAGFLPPELELRKEIRELRQLLDTLDDEQALKRARTRLSLLMTRLQAGGHAELSVDVEREYHQRLLARLDDSPANPA